MKVDLMEGGKLLYKYDAFEVHPCAEVEPGIIEQVEPEAAEFWSVYVHYDPNKNPDQFGGLDCIADCDTENQAKALVEFLNDLIKKNALA